MQVLGMYGYVDKYDMVMTIARVLNIMDKSVLVIDATLDDKYKYIVPAIVNEEKYITQYSEIDFAVGFSNYDEIITYINEKGMDINRYNYVILDVETPEKYEEFSGINVDKSYLYVNTNVLSVRKTGTLVKKMREIQTESDILFSKIYYRAYISRASNTYLEDKIDGYNVKWSDESYDVSIDEQDMMVNIDSQYSGIIDVRRHTKPYVYLVSELVSKLLGDTNSKEIMKQIKRRKN